MLPGMSLGALFRFFFFFFCKQHLLKTCIHNNDGKKGKRMESIHFKNK